MLCAHHAQKLGDLKIGPGNADRQTHENTILELHILDFFIIGETWGKVQKGRLMLYIVCCTVLGSTYVCACSMKNKKVHPGSAWSTGHEEEHSSPLKGIFFNLSSIHSRRGEGRITVEQPLQT